MIYLIIVNIALLICFGLYHLCFRKLTFFQWNRMYLIGSILIALLIPIGLFIDLSDFMREDELVPTIDLGDMIDYPIVYMAAVDKSFYLMDILKPIYVLGIGIMFLLLSYRLYLIKELFQKGNPFMSFSFFNKVFLGKNLQSSKVIESHEQVHVVQGHSYDIILIELVKVFNWFNPVVYFMAKEMKFQHECIADEICSEDRVAYAELLVANAMRVDKSALVHEFSNHSFLKKRIMMLFKNKSSNTKKLFYLSAIPMLLLVAGSTLVFNTSKAKELVNTVEQEIEDVALPVKVEQWPAIEPAVDVLGEEEESVILTSDQQDTTKKSRGEDVFSLVEINPEPPGGMTAYRKWIAENYQFPQAAIDAGVKGTIQTAFVVEKDGSLSDLKIVRDLSYGTGQAAITLLKTSKKWSPGIQNGKPVRIAYTLPIRIDLSGNEKTSIENDSITKEVLKSNKSADSEDVVFEVTEILPEPPGGMAAFRKWIGDNYQYPSGAIDAGVKGTIEISFIVEKDGSLSNITVKKDLGYNTGEASVNLLKKSAKWSPAIQNGRKVRIAYTLPIRLDLTNM